MKFYHGTNEEGWAAIQKEGVLYGDRGPVVFDDGTKLAPDRCTYLAVNSQQEAGSYGEIVLEVDYKPGTNTDNYVEGCWQFRVYGPISLENVRRVK